MYFVGIVTDHISLVRFTIRGRKNKIPTPPLRSVILHSDSSVVSFSVSLRCYLPVLQGLHPEYRPSHFGSPVVRPRYSCTLSPCWHLCFRCFCLTSKGLFGSARGPGPFHPVLSTVGHHHHRVLRVMIRRDVSHFTDGRGSSHPPYH